MKLKIQQHNLHDLFIYIYNKTLNVIFISFKVKNTRPPIPYKYLNFLNI